jgi:CubicO group peptidase (beta-lactamase class C family)
MRQLLVVGASIALLSGSSGAQNLSQAERLDDYVAPLVGLGIFSGAVAVAQGDSIILERYYGKADIEHEIANRRETVFRIASISKPFTRALAGCLADRKLLELDDPIARWFPGFPSSAKITVRMLLDHRAGVPNVNSLPFDEEAIGANTLSALVDSIAKRPLDYEPGTRRSYSNGGYAVLGRILELASGERYDSLLTSAILRPLGMTRTGHEATGSIVKSRARGYMPSPETHGELVAAPWQEMDTKTAGGSLVSDIADLVTWMRAIGRSSILSDVMWAELFPAKDSVFGFQGRSPGFNAYVEHDRKRDRTIVVLANNYAAASVSDLAAAAESIASGRTPPSLPVKAEIRMPEEDLRRLSGSYTLPAGVLPVPDGSKIELRLVNKHVVAFLGGTPVDVLIPQAAGRFLARSLWSIIELPEAGAVDSIRVRALYADRSFTAVRSP